MEAVNADLTDEDLAWYLARSLTASDEAAHRLMAEARSRPRRWSPLSQAFAPSPTA